MGRLCERLALAVGWTPTEAELLRHASALHDVGKIGIPDRVLLKPGQLDPGRARRSWRPTRPRARAARRLALRRCCRSPRSSRARTTSAGTARGYPAGLAGEEIPLAGRICAICDVFDALVSERPYKEAWPAEAALDEIRRQAGSQFDPQLVEVFLGLEMHAPASDTWPVGDRAATRVAPAASRAQG